jgi:hypothetical protein
MPVDFPSDLASRFVVPDVVGDDFLERLQLLVELLGAGLEVPARRRP